MNLGRKLVGKLHHAALEQLFDAKMAHEDHIDPAFSPEQGLSGLQIIFGSFDPRFCVLFHRCYDTSGKEFCQHWEDVACSTKRSWMR